MLPTVPDEWRETLSVIAPVFGKSSCYIAGGALRDLILGRAPNDVDVFVGEDWTEERLSELGEWEDTTRQLREKFASEIEGSASQGPDEIQRIVDLRRPSGTLYQIVERRPNPRMEQLLDRFDFGICRIAWDGCHWCIHQDFLKDISAKSFTARPGLVYPAATLRRARGFANRFQGWKYDLRLVGGGEGQW